MRFAFPALLLAALTLAPQAFAQPAPATAAVAADITKFVSAADIQALVAKAKATRKPDQALVLQPLVVLAPYTANLEYRAIPGPVAVHPKEAELMVVLDGSGTLTTGGTVTDPKPASPTAIAITGGTPQPIAKGDIIFVPQNTPHQFTEVKDTLILMTLHVPRPPAP